MQGWAQPLVQGTSSSPGSLGFPRLEQRELAQGRHRRPLGTGVLLAAVG